MPGGIFPGFYFIKGEIAMSNVKISNILEQYVELGEEDRALLMHILTKDNPKVVYVGTRANLNPPYSMVYPPTFVVSKKGSFDAAHNNPELPGKCANIHGHTYYYEIFCKGHVDPKTGIMIDFRELKRAMKEEVEDKLDHKYLNEVLTFVTSAENVAAWILKQMQERFREVFKVRLWENETSFVEVEYESF
jgi:6-pyruvoyltetrahydropterin/6-carboxytetrahydropterin synthase